MIYVWAPLGPAEKERISRYPNGHEFIHRVPNSIDSTMHTIQSTVAHGGVYWAGQGGDVGVPGHIDHPTAVIVYSTTKEIVK